MTIELKNVYKSYDGVHNAVTDFNLEIDDGEFIILVGPSGCGKTTTLRMIAGLEGITEGTLSIDGVVVNDVLPKDRDLAMVFQSYALYPHMTVAENIGYPLKLRKVAKEEAGKKIKEVAELLGIAEYLGRKPSQLSGGQKQRVALGRCIIRSPKAFLMDEPLSNLDAKLRVQMRSEIIRLHQQLKKTFIYVTHDQVEAMTMGDRIVVMKDGFIQQVASSQDLYEDPANRFVAEFIGSPAMNVSSFDSGQIAFNGAGLDLGINQAVDVGIRPEKISIGQRQGLPFEAKIVTVEPLGGENYLNIMVNDEFYTVRDFTLQPVTEGETMTFSINPEDLKIFNGIDGKRLYL